VKVPKKVPGQFFEDLDLLTKLLAPIGRASAAKPKIEVIGMYCVKGNVLELV
jgi:hypothetical protein